MGVESFVELVCFESTDSSIAAYVSTVSEVETEAQRQK